MTKHINTQKQRIVYLLLLLTMTFSCTQIELPKAEEGKATETQDIRILTKSSSDVEINYPIVVYAINESGITVNRQEISSEDENLSLALPEGKYTIVAYAGTDGYVFTESQETGCLISLPDNGTLPATPLLSGKANISVSDKDVQTTIMMSYCVSMINMQLTNVPYDAEEVSITLSPLYGSIDLDGNYYDGNRIFTVKAIHNISNDSWDTPPIYCFSNKGNELNLSIEIKTPDEQKAYGHKTDLQLLPNTPYELSGNYEEGFYVNGIFEYQGWNPPVEIDFSFGENISEDDTESPTVDIEEIPSIWNGHLVIDKSENENGETEVILLSLEEWDDVYSAYNEDYPDECISIAEGYSEGNITSGWEVPSATDGRKLFELLEDNDFTDKVNDLLKECGERTLSYSDAYDYNNNKVRYLYDEGRKTFSVGSDGTTSTSGKSRTYNLRLIYKIKY